MSQLKEFGQGLIDPSFCCCAIPLVNFGIYSILGEQAVVGILIGVLALVTPTVVGAVFPSFANIIFAITCWAVAAVQPLGFIGVMREKTKTFKFYGMLNGLAVAAAFSTAAALIIASALRHSTAVTNCETQYFNNSTTAANSTAAQTMLASEGPLLCSPFAWADVGIMGGLWILLLLVQGYFVYITRTYSVSQVSDHKLYHSVYSENPEAFTMSILRSTRYNPGSVYNNMPPPGPHADAWDERPSMDSLREGQGDGYGYGNDYGDGGYHYAPGGMGYGQNHSGSGSEPGGGHEAAPAYGLGHERSESYTSEQGRYEDAYGYGDQDRFGHAALAAGGSYADFPAPYPSRQSGNGGGGGGSDVGGGYEAGAEGYGAGAGYPFSQQGEGYIHHPAEAHAGRDPGHTPTMNDYTAGQGVGFAGGGGLQRPDGVQGHPAEGMFGRKSPRPMR